MPSWIDMTNFAIVIAGLTIAILCLTMTILVRQLDSWTHTAFIAMFTILILYTLSNLISQISLMFPDSGSRELTMVAIYLESLFSSLLMPLITVYILHTCGESVRCRFFNIVMVFWSVYTVLLVITQFTTFIYYVTPSNVYKRGPIYPILLLPPVLLMLSNLIGLIIRKDKLSGRHFKAMLIFLLMPLFSMIAQMFSYGIFFVVLGTAVSSFILFLYILNDTSEKYIEQKIALSEKTFRAKTLQMRPHFIYNTMANIYYLCDIDPKKARQVVDDFSTYLKKNFSAIAKDELVPFEDELEHTRAYLNVVKVRYENLLFVEYDTEYTAFQTPPLTLQPIVENAVKYALDPESAPLHILISTKETNDSSMITVENTGLDFIDQTSPASDQSSDNEVHLGLENTISRLKTLCSGSLVITPRPGGGTIVTITIPK